jgi:hypothetical protein
MERMSKKERHDWMHRTGRVHVDLSDRATHGGFACDDCGAPSISISHTGDGTPVVVRCVDCFRADMARRAEERKREHPEP